MHERATEVVAGIFDGIEDKDAEQLRALLDHIKGNLTQMLEEDGRLGS